VCARRHQPLLFEGLQGEAPTDIARHRIAHGGDQPLVEVRVAQLEQRMAEFVNQHLACRGPIAGGHRIRPAR